MPAASPRTAGIRGSLKLVCGDGGKEFSRRDAENAEKKEINCNMAYVILLSSSVYS